MAWTAAQIVSMACQSTNPPATGRLAQAGQMLNMILNNLSQTVDLELTRGVFNFNFIADNGSGNGMGPYQLPMNYWRHTHDGVFFTIDGIKYYLTPLDQSEFDLQPVTPGLANYPTTFYTDISPLAATPASNPLIWVWQPSNGVYPVTVRYYKWLPRQSRGSPTRCTSCGSLPGNLCCWWAIPGLLNGCRMPRAARAPARCCGPSSRTRRATTRVRRRQ
jgi:hypothetical protein